MAFYCNWAFDTLVVTCDGTVVCGCADPFNERPVGHLEQNDLLKIWHGDAMTEARDAISRGAPGKICQGCGLGTEISAHTPTPALTQGPTRLLIEPTIVCNLRCPIDSCEVNNSAPPRTKKFMDFEQFRKMMDQAGPTLERAQFYNYGEPFIHTGTVRMIRHIKDHFPKVWVDSSTNGHFFQNESKCREIVESGIDRLIFSVDGATQSSYEHYRKGGDLRRVLDAMATIVGYRNLKGLKKPEIMWRYILFAWNDSFSEMRAAKRLAREIGVDSLCWHLSLPVEGASKKFKSDSWRTKWRWNEFFDSGPWPNALPEKRTSARPSLLKAKIKANAPTKLKAGETCTIPIWTKNIGDSTWLAQAIPEGRFVTLAPQIFNANNEPISLANPRVYLEADLKPRASAKLSWTFQAPTEPGVYRMRLDMVNELHSWFADLGSRPYEATIRVTTP